jgi:hypothetical protein
MGRTLKLAIVSLALAIGLDAYIGSSNTAMAQNNQTAAAGSGYELHIAAVPVPGAEPMKEQVRYKVEALDGAERGKVVAYHTGSELKAQLPAGRYRVTSVFGLATTTSDVKIVDGPVYHETSLNAGGITLALMPYFGAPNIKDDIEWVVWTFGRDALGNRWEVARVRGPNPRLMLPEGYYIVTAEHRGALAKHTIEVTAGNNYNYAINLNAGTMRVYTEAAAGANPDVTVFWKIYPQGSDGTGEPLASGSSTDDTFLLPGGRYLLVGVQGDKAVRKEIEVSPGKKQSLKVSF